MGVTTNNDIAPTTKAIIRDLMAHEQKGTLNLSVIARKHGISRQRVHQIWAAEKRRRAGDGNR